jgi:hypothetical protein
MSSTPATPTKPSHKERFIDEMKDYLNISAYLAVLFCTLTAYTMLISRHAEIDSTLTFGFALLNALVIGKVILIGEMMKLGHGTEGRPLYQTILLKSFLFGLLIFAFHVLEEFVKRLIHHLPAGTVLHEVNLEQLAARSLVILIALIPLFAFRELARILGEKQLHQLFLRPTA